MPLPREDHAKAFLPIVSAEAGLTALAFFSHK